MAAIVVTYDDRGVALFRRAAKELSTNLLTKIARQAIGRAGDKTRTKVRQALKRQMGTKTAGVITRATRSAQTDTTYTIIGSGGGLPITEFPVSGSRKKQSSWRDQPRDARGRFGPLANRSDAGLVTARPWAVAHRFKRSFVHPTKGFVARLPGSNRLRKLYGPGVGKELVLDQSLSAFETFGIPEFERQMVQRLSKVLP
jgi:hypothetical protein